MCGSTTELIAAGLSNPALHYTPHGLGDYPMNAQVLALIAEPSEAFYIVPSPYKAAVTSRLSQSTYRSQNPAAVPSAQGDGQRAVALSAAGLVLHAVRDSSPDVALVSCPAIGSLT